MEVRKGFKQMEVGVIPENWEFKELRNYFSFISYGFTNPMPTVSDGVYMITANDINNGRIKLETARKTSELAFKTFLSDKSRPKKNDILLTKDGTLGRIALVGDEKICINQSVAVIRPNEKIYPLFLKLLLEGTYYQKTMIDNAGGSTIKHIYIINNNDTIKIDIWYVQNKELLPFYQLEFSLGKANIGLKKKNMLIKQFKNYK